MYQIARAAVLRRTAANWGSAEEKFNTGILFPAREDTVQKHPGKEKMLQEKPHRSSKAWGMVPARRQSAQSAPNRNTQDSRKSLETFPVWSPAV